MIVKIDTTKLDTPFIINHQGKDMKKGILIGEGERSKVYENLDDKSTVIKITSNKYEKEVADYFYNNPSDVFVKIHSIEKIGRKYVMIIDRLEEVDFKFELKNGTFFLESMFNNGVKFKNVYFDENRMNEYIEEITKRVVDRQKDLVKPYYEFLKKCLIEHGMGIYETAWNLGIKDGKFICFDTAFIN